MNQYILSSAAAVSVLLAVLLGGCGATAGPDQVLFVSSPEQAQQIPVGGTVALQATVWACGERLETFTARATLDSLLLSEFEVVAGSHGEFFGTLPVAGSAGLPVGEHELHVEVFGHNPEVCPDRDDAAFELSHTIRFSVVESVDIADDGGGGADGGGSSDGGGGADGGGSSDGGGTSP